MFNKQFFRVAVGVAVLVALIISIAPSLYLFNSADGVVNGRILILRSPIAGTLEFTRKTAYGTHFEKDEMVCVVTNPRVDQSFLHKLITEHKTLNARIESLGKRIETFTALDASLATNLDKYQEYSQKQLTAMISQIKGKLQEEKAEQERARKEVEATRVLSQSKASTQRELERHETNLEVSAKRITQHEARLEELENSLAAVQSGAFLGDGHNDSPYSKQRKDQLVIEMSLAKTARDEALSRIEGIDLQIAKEKERIAKAERHEARAPFDALVWRMPSINGSTLTIDSEIIIMLDCSSIFLDATVSESQFAKVRPGDKVRYRMIGDSKGYTGTVQALRGSGSAMGDINLAASLNKDPKKEFRVWIQTDPSDMELTAENFFQIGRRVEVKLSKRWNPGDAFSWFLHVF